MKGKIFSLFVVFALFLALAGCGAGGGETVVTTTTTGGDEGGSVIDTTPPTVPGEVMAEAAGPYEVVISWNPSSDDVGVVGYKVYRDGNAIATATATATAYSDTGLEPDTEYCYSVSAFDAAGNESDISAESCAITSAEVNIWTLGADYNAQHILATADGVYVSGRYNGWARPFVAKIVGGDVEWTTILPGDGDKNNATGIAEYAGNIYVSYFTDYFGQSTGYKEYVAVLDGETGTVIKTISVSTCGSTGYGPGLAVDFSGIYSAGLYCLQKVDFEGNLLWEKTPGVISSVKTDGNGNVYVGGYAAGPTGEYDLMAVKYSSDGDQIWSAMWGTPNLDMGGALAFSGDGNVYLAGGGVDNNLKSLPVVVVTINDPTGEVAGKTDFSANSSGSGGIALGPNGPVVAMGDRLMYAGSAGEWNVPASASFTADTLAILDGVVYVAYENTIRRYDVDTGAEITD